MTEEFFDKIVDKIEGKFYLLGYKFRKIYLSIIKFLNYIIKLLKSIGEILFVCIIGIPLIFFIAFVDGLTGWKILSNRED